MGVIWALGGPDRGRGHHVYAIITVSPPSISSLPPFATDNLPLTPKYYLDFFLSVSPSESSVGGRAKVRHALADSNGDILIDLFKIQDINIKPPVLRSEEAMSTPASVILPSPLTKAKLASVNPYPTLLVLPHASACLKARLSTTRRSPMIYQLRACTAPHPPQLRAFCTGLRCRLMILVRNPVVLQSIAEILVSTAARLPSLRPLLLASTSRRLSARRSARARRAMKSKRRGSPAKARGLERSRMGRVVLLALRRRGSWTLKFWGAALESRGPTLTFKLCGERSRSELSLLPQLVRLSVAHSPYI